MNRKPTLTSNNQNPTVSQSLNALNALNSTWHKRSPSDSLLSKSSDILTSLNMTWHAGHSFNGPLSREGRSRSFDGELRELQGRIDNAPQIPTKTQEGKDEDPIFKVFCFPHAGGAAHSFQHWDTLALQESIELIRLDYPRSNINDTTRSTPHATSIVELASLLLPQIIEELDRPFIFFGHSMGGVVAYEVTKLMMERGLPKPSGLIISSVPPPDYPDQHDQLSTLNEDDFVKQAYALGWFPKEGIENVELRKIMVPNLFKDIKMYENYTSSFQQQYATQESKASSNNDSDNNIVVTTPLYIVGGSKDNSVTIKSLESWSKYTTSTFTLTILPEQGHFHLHTDATFQLLSTACRNALNGRKDSIAVGREITYEDEKYCIHEIFTRQALSTPDAIAVVDERRGPVTFRTMLQEVNLLASWLRYHRVGIGLQGVVGILSPTTADYLIAIFGVMQSGGAVLPFYTNYTKELINDLVDSANVKFMIVDETIDTSMIPNGCASFSLGNEWANRLRVQIQKIETQENKEEKEEQEQLQFGEQEQQEINRHSKQFQLYTTPPTVPTHACCMMAMTSGSTGKPKAIVVSHHATMMALCVRNHLFPFNSNSIVASNIFFIWEAFRAPISGTAVHIIPDDVLLDPKKFSNFLYDCKATDMVVTAQLTKNLLDYPNLDLKHKLKYMKHWYLCGEVCPRSTAKQWNDNVLPSTELWNYYSTWESLDVSYTRLSPFDSTQTELSASRFACVGLPMPNVCIYVVNPTTMQPVKQGVLGEVYIGSRGSSDGYFNDVIRTTNAFVDNPFNISLQNQKRSILALPLLDETMKTSNLFISHWGEASHPSALLMGSKLNKLYKTGDRGRLLANGELELAGRDGNIVKIRGFKVGLLMVENALLSMKDIIKSCLVLPILHLETKQPTSLVAYIVGPNAEEKPTKTQCELVLSKLRTILPSYAIPEYIVSLKTFPTRPGSGKMDKKKLPPPTDGIRAGSSTSSSSNGNGRNNRSNGSMSNGTDQLEKVIVSVWVEVLGQEVDFNTTDNFFEIGGHSLKAATLIGLLTAKFGLNLTVVDLYSCPTVQSLADLLREKLGTNNGTKRVSTRSISTHHNVHEDKGTTATPQIQKRVDVAVIGMAGKFPGANNINEFWNNLTKGVDSLRTFTEEELIRCGVSKEIREHPNFIKKGQVIDHPDQFDAYFWGIGKEEAKMMDPQQRQFLQICWHAMEDAGYPPRSGSNFETGVFASCGIDGYMIHHLDGAKILREGTLDPASIFKTEVGNEKDYISTRVSYHLNLGGPSYTINSACSSGLVSVSEAVNSIQSGRCDVALAGASSLTFPNTGYLYSEGLVSSPDGHVRPFDEKAGGTLFGDGIGAVVLKRLDDAIKDGDRIMAVVRGAAVTNDGRDKAGYSAPASAAQQRAIVRAQRRAGVTSDQISYVECHATATHVGDAIEMRGLKEAFAENRYVSSSLSSLLPSSSPLLTECALGSVKGNIGHANCAAGITGFMKTVLCLYHKTLVPTVHYSKLNSKINLSNTGFSINNATKKWIVNPKGRGPEGKDGMKGMNGEIEGTIDDATLRVAGVSSFGVGGTNAHVVLQEAPTTYTSLQEETKDDILSNTLLSSSSLSLSSSKKHKKDEIIIVSAKTINSLKNNLLSLANHVEMNEKKNEQIQLADIALTLSIGREHLQYRYSQVVRTNSDLITTLRSDVLNKSKFKEMIKVKDTGSSIGGDVIFVFPGQGSQYIQMSQGLYQNEPTYRKHLDACAKVIDRIHQQRGVCATSLNINSSGIDKMDQLDGSNSTSERDSSNGVLDIMFGTDASIFLRPSYVQPCIFMVEYCMARTLMDYGIVPLAMGGHSIGEYVAATLAGVFQLEDALELIVLRGIATETCAVEGNMLSISKIDQKSLSNILTQHVGVTVATHNAPGMYVLSGTPKDIQTLHASLTANPPSEKTRIVLLKVNRAFHSPLMDEAAKMLEDFLKQVEMKSPSIPVTSNVTGNWMGDECREPKYWGDHMRGTVRFVDNAKCLAQWSAAAIVEVGPGSTLCKLLTKCWTKLVTAESSVSSLPPPSLSTTPPLVPSMRHPKATDVSDSHVFHATLGKLWCSGVSANWKTYHEKRRNQKNRDDERTPRKISLPGYSFAETSYWCDSNKSIYVVDDINNSNAMVLKKETTMLTNNDCLVVLTGGTSKEVKKIIVCFTYAGGSSRTFVAWKKEIIKRGLNQTVQILAVELQGRGKRSEEGIATSQKEDDIEIQNIADGLTRHLNKVQRGTSVVLCGLSMGALYAIRVSKKIHVPNGIVMSEIVLAGRCPPFDQMNNECTEGKPFTEEDVAQYNLTSSEITASAAWRDHFLPLLLSDLAVDQRLSLSSELLVPTQFNVRIVCGMKDPSFPQERAVEWEQVGGSALNITLLNGGHEFLNEKVSEMISVCLGDDAMHLNASNATSMVGNSSNTKATPSPVFQVEWLPSGVYKEQEKMKFNQNNYTDLTLSNEKELETIKNMKSIIVLRIVSCPVSVSKDPTECTNYHINQAWLFTQCVQSIIQQLETNNENDLSRIHIILVAEDSTNAIFGTSRSVTLEFPEITFQRLLITYEEQDEDEEEEGEEDDDNDEKEVSMQLITSVAQQYSNEPDLEYNIDTNLVRLRRASPSPITSTTNSLDKKVLHGDGIYVLTGGTGGIGSVLVKWLIEVQGVAPGDIVLLTRRKGPHLHPLGCQMITLDVSTPTQWTDVQIKTLRCITDSVLLKDDNATETKTRTDKNKKKRKKKKRVLGLFHLAGILDDGTLTNMTRERVEKVMAPKVHGILHLLALSKQWKWKTKYAVVFSSTTSLFGYPGQTNYAAANSVLDGLATSSVTNNVITGGVPIICCNWGPWGEVGMAQIGSKPYNSALKGGELPMMTLDALNSLEHVLRSFSSGNGGSRQVGICRVEWSRSEWSGTPMICKLTDEKVPLPPVKQKKRTNEDNDEDDDEDLPKDDIERFFASRVSSWMPSETLTALGVDSLDEVQLRNDFQREFSIKVPLSMFVVPNQMLNELCIKLREYMKK